MRLELHLKVVLVLLFRVSGCSLEPRLVSNCPAAKADLELQLLLLSPIYQVFNLGYGRL